MPDKAGRFAGPQQGGNQAVVDIRKECLHAGVADEGLYRQLPLATTGQQAALPVTEPVSR